MLRHDLQSRIDRLWDAFWAGGISNPLEVVEQVSYLIFVRWLDDLQVAKERAATETDEPIVNPIYTDTSKHLRWSHFTAEAPQNMIEIVRNGVFPWLRDLRNPEITYSRHLKDARFTLTTPSLLVKVVDTLDDIPLSDPKVGGDLYDYLLSKISSSGLNGQFRTPRHIVALITEMMAPGPNDEICDPACGTAGFLVSAASYVSRTHADTLSSLTLTQVPSFENGAFHGFDFDSTMLRIASMNMLLHGVKAPDIRYHDSLSESLADAAGRYSLILSNPPFAGSLDYEATAKDLLSVVKTKKTELLFLALALKLLKPGGRAAIIVPDGVLFGSSKAHLDLRRHLIEENRLDAVVKLPPGTFRPYAGISTSILFFTKAASGGTDNVWFYEVTADGWTLDDRRRPLLDGSKLGPTPSAPLTRLEHDRNNLPDVVDRWARREGSEQHRKRTEQSFIVAKREIADCSYDLSLNRYRVTAREGWRLGDFAEVFAGSVRANEIDRNRGSVDVDVAHRVLHPSLLTSTLPAVDELPVRTSLRRPSRALRPGDVVGRDLAGIRHWTVVPAEYDGVQLGQGVLVVRVVRNVLPPEYIAAYLSTPQAEQQLPRYEVIPRIRRSELSELRIPECEGDFEAIRSAIAKLRKGAEEVSRISRRLQELKISIFDEGGNSERWGRLEQAADQSLLIAQSLRKHVEPHQTFQETYPYAIARAVRKLNHSASVADKHEAAMQCVESLITSLGIVSLAFTAHWGKQGLPDVVKWFEAVRRGGVSLGHWVGVIRAAGAFARESGDEAGGLADATAPKRKGKGLLSDLDELVARRNKIRHGAGPRTRAEVGKSLAELEQLMFRSLSASAFLAKMQWIHMDQLRWLPTLGKYEISGLALMGDHPDFEPIVRLVDYPLPDNALYMFLEQGQAIPFWPFCILGDCPQCLAPELYYPDRLTNSTALLKSLDRGHELESDSIFRSLHSLTDHDTDVRRSSDQA